MKLSLRPRVRSLVDFPHRQRRLFLEPLERRFCLTAELGFVTAGAEAGSLDLFDEVELDASGNFYVSSNDQLIKYSPSRSILWAVNLPQAFELAVGTDARRHFQ